MSYEYLSQSRLHSIKLAKEVKRVPDFTFELTPDDEDKLKEIQEECIIFDFHNNPIILPENMEDLMEYCHRGRFWTAYRGLKESKIDACLNGFGSLAYISSTIGYQFSDVIYDLGMRFSDFEHHTNDVVIARSSNDIYRAKKEGKVAMLAMLENAGAIGNVLDRLDVLYGLGIKCMGLTHNDNNYIGGGRTDRANTGLSRFGVQVIERMNDLGILIDLAHSSDKTIQEALEISKKPCCSTHDCCLEVSKNIRCKKNSTLKAIADKGGVIGIHAIPNVLSKLPEQGIEDVLQHIDHAVNICGINAVAVGTDSIFGDHVEMHKKMLESVCLGIELKEFPAIYMKGIENPGDFHNITRGLIKRGYKNNDIKKIIGENVIRIIKEVFG